jgi:acyl carrier protein
MRKSVWFPALCALAAAAACEAPSAPHAKSSEITGQTGSRVKRIVVQQLRVDPARVTPRARFFHDLGADSLDCVEMIMAFEEEFEVQITDGAAARMVTVGDVVAWLQASRR